MTDTMSDSVRVPSRPEIEAAFEVWRTWIAEPKHALEDHFVAMLKAAYAAAPAPAADVREAVLVEAAKRVVQVMMDAPYGVSFGSIMETAVLNLNAALASRPAMDEGSLEEIYEATREARLREILHSLAGASESVTYCSGSGPTFYREDLVIAAMRAVAGG